MDAHLHQFILQTTGATAIREIRELQNLWSGYGHIWRCRLSGGTQDSVVVKQVRWPERQAQVSSRSHDRKVRSYQVEMTWYREWAHRCSAARIPCHLAQQQRPDGIWLILEDLDASGFGSRSRNARDNEVRACLEWLARFHALFLGERPRGLWKIGTYWHLETRPEELRRMNDPALRNAAPHLDRLLRGSPFQTLVHGDAKLANFCFSRDGGQVAAVDFQYVGGGAGIRDVAYLIDSCYTEENVARLEKELLDFYFRALRRALAECQPEIHADAVEADWRALYPVAWTDFHRFLKGWSPGHWNPQGYSETTARKVLATLGRKPA